MDAIKIEQAKSDYQKIVSFIEDGSPLPPETDPYYEACAALDRLGGFIADIEGAKNTEQSLALTRKEVNMFVDNKKEMFYAKTLPGKIAEGLFGFVLLLVALPFLVVFIIGKGAGKVCDFIADKEDAVVKKAVGI